MQSVIAPHRTDNLPPSGCLVLPATVYRQIIDHVRRELPNESVGLLATITSAGGERATRYFAGTNIDASPDRFTMQPADVRQALTTIRASGERLGAVVHSHPCHPATPSSTDVAEYRSTGALMLIVSLAGEEPHVRGWTRREKAGGIPSMTEVAISLESGQTRTGENGR